jgi:hypothetical protein
MNTPDAPNASFVVPHFEFTAGARYWVGELFGYLLDFQYKAVERQFAEKRHLEGHFSRAVDVLTVPSGLHEGKTFQVFVWKPYAGKGSYWTTGLETPMFPTIQTNHGFFCVMPKDEQKQIRDTIAKTIPKILNYPGGGYVTAPECQPHVRNGKFYWGNSINVNSDDGDQTGEHRRVMNGIRIRTETKSSKPINTLLSHRKVEILMVDMYEELKYSIAEAPKNKSGYKSAITLHFD